MQRPKKFESRLIVLTTAALFSACWLQPVFAAELARDVLDPAEVAARDSWSATMAHNPASTAGCFHASYPSFVWEEVTCKVLHPRVHTMPRKPEKAAEQVTGNGDDYVVESSGLISETLGTFPSATGIKTEKSVGVAAFGDGGILGANEYSIQLNSNYTRTTAACKSHSGCTIWEQFIYATDYETEGEGAVFIQYWLLDWGKSACPSGFGSDGEGDCYANSKYVSAPDQNITTLANLKLSAGAVSGGNDSLTFNNGTEAYSITASDSVLDLATVWTESEFNIVGDAGGSRADFNKPVSVTVHISVSDGSTAAPKCVANAGSTGETNNLNLGSCSASGGSSPSIQFTESN